MTGEATGGPGDRSLLNLAATAEEALDVYCRNPHYAWPSYDTADRSATSLSPCDVTITELLQARIPASKALEMFQAPGSAACQLREQINAILGDEDIATMSFEELAFEQLDGEETVGPWGVVRDAFRLALAVPRITSVGVSKILHRFRPEFVPIHDRRLREFYGVANTATRSNRFYEALHTDLHRAGVVELLDQWRSPHPGMSRLRAADIVIWMQSELGRR